MFLKNLQDCLLLKWPNTTDNIDLILGSSLPVFLHIEQYLSSVEIEKQLQKLLEDGKIFPSTFPYGSLVPIIPNKEHDHQTLCTNHRALNKMTVKIKYSLPRIDDLIQ